MKRFLCTVKVLLSKIFAGEKRTIRTFMDDCAKNINSFGDFVAACIVVSVWLLIRIIGIVLVLLVGLLVYVAYTQHPVVVVSLVVFVAIPFIIVSVLACRGLQDEVEIEMRRNAVHRPSTKGKRKAPKGKGRRKSNGRR